MSQVIPEAIVKILPKGLITIPKKLRLQLGFADNSLARVRAQQGKLVVEPLKTLPYRVRSYTNKEIRKFLELDKKEGKELRKQGLI